jgi:adenylate kinase
MDRGEYVPDDLVVKMVMERLGEPDAENGFILDGFPRTIPQAVALQDGLEGVGTQLTGVLSFHVGDETATRRITGRYTCPECKRTYHVEFHPPANDLQCDVDGTALEKRSDEDDLTVMRRLAVYREQTEPLEGFYEDRGLLRRIDAEASIEEVTKRMMAVISELT